MRRLLAAFALCFAASVAPAALEVHSLTCDWTANPLGIDSSTPRLAWKLRGQQRGARQTAWQVQVASTTDKLAAGDADRWDSRQRDGDTQLQLRYEGRPLTTGERVFWRVRVWDETGEPSPWSDPGTWTMGVVSDTDWRASWITDPDLQRATRQRMGFSTPPTPEESTTHWIALDLGAEFPVEQIGLHAVTHTVNERLGFPQWFKLEVARRSDFRDATVVADHTADPINQWFTRYLATLSASPVRYVRLTVPRLRMMEEDHGGKPQGRLALSQIEIRSGGRNVATVARVTSSASLEDDRWSAAALVDGLGIPGINPRSAETLRLRREFNVRPGLLRATLFISGLGHYTLSANGTGIADDQLLKPGWTDYSKTVLYDTHDLTPILRSGRNALGLTLAGGMFNVPFAPGRYTKFVGPPRALRALAQLHLEYEDGATEILVTDENWRTARGPVTFAHIYGGEDYDAIRASPGWDQPGFDDSNWTRAKRAIGDLGRLRGTSHAAPPLRTHETLPPVAINELRPGIVVYDLGQNAALIPRLRVRGPAGATVKITPSELLHADGSINPRSTHSNSTEAAWNYRLSGERDGETWQPSFFYHGARYLQVELTAPDGARLPIVERLEGLVFHTSSPAIGHFACSDEMLNRIRMLVRWAQRSNAVHVLTDCPHRERLGWLEQYHLNGPAIRSEFDLTRLYAKGLGDMADAQLSHGLVPSIAPEYIRFDGYFRDSPEWGSALILAAAQQFAWSGDDTVLDRHYGAMQRYFDYLTMRAQGGILSHGLGDWYDLGPGKHGVSQLTSIALVATAIYYEDARALALIAERLGRTADAARYTTAAKAIAAAFNAKFLDSSSGRYDTGSQTAQAMPLALRLVPDTHRAATLARLVEQIERDARVATAGDVGYRYLLLALAEAGRSDLIHTLINQSDKPGYGYQLARGATALTEAWDAHAGSSQNHFMLGHITEWFYSRLAGISPDPARPGFGRILVRPEPVGDLRWAEASLDTVRGRVAVRWERGEGIFTLSVEVPANVRALVQLPGRADARVSLDGRDVAQHSDLVRLGLVEERPSFEIGAGRYVFEVRD